MTIYLTFRKAMFDPTPHYWLGTAPQHREDIERLMLETPTDIVAAVPDSPVMVREAVIGRLCVKLGLIEVLPNPRWPTIRQFNPQPVSQQEATNG
jgi:hypothetical protein